MSGCAAVRPWKVWLAAFTIFSVVTCAGLCPSPPKSGSRGVPAPSQGLHHNARMHLALFTKGVQVEPPAASFSWLILLAALLSPLLARWAQASAGRPLVREEVGVARAFLSPRPVRGPPLV